MIFVFIHGQSQPIKMDATNPGRDWWCEKQLIYGGGNGDDGIVIAEPIAASTGVVMLAVFLVWPRVIRTGQTKVPAVFVALRISLVMLALGTVVFHSMSYETSMEKVHVNLNLFDWMPLVLTGASLILLFLQPWIEGIVSAYWRAGAYVAIVTWALFLCISMDSRSYEFWEDVFSWCLLLNGIFLVPLAGVLLYSTFWVLGLRKMWRLWVLLSVGLLMWILNVSLCEKASWLAPLHGFYHIVMAFALVHAACLGLVMNYGFEFVDAKDSVFWMLCVAEIEKELTLVRDKEQDEKWWLLKDAEDFLLPRRF